MSACPFKIISVFTRLTWSRGHDFSSAMTLARPHLNIGPVISCLFYGLIFHTSSSSGDKTWQAKKQYQKSSCCSPDHLKGLTRIYFIRPVCPKVTVDIWEELGHVFEERKSDQNEGKGGVRVSAISESQQRSTRDTEIRCQLQKHAKLRLLLGFVHLEWALCTV